MKSILTISIVLLFWTIIDFYCFQALKMITKSYSPTIRKRVHLSFWLFDIVLILIILFCYFTGLFSAGPTKNLIWIMGLIILSIVPKLVVIPFLLLEDVSRGIHVAINWISKKTSSKKTPVSLFTGRRKFVSQMGLGLGSLPFFGIIYGTWKGKYDYRLHKIKLTFKDLPEAFNGFTITQISDIHSGSFNDKEAVMKGIQLANSQKSDLLVFTGDLVNNKAEEMNDWIDSFSLLDAKMGKFSILGNHDYGDYTTWNSEEEKEDNLKRLKEIHQEIGFKLLLNENLKIEKEGQTISLLGVENWGMKGFHKHGNLNKALHEIEDSDFKILLSHDPSHWEAQVLRHEKHIHLTLSGHTHGMQFGIEIPGFKWSPIKYLYPQWAGAYEKDNKYIYVNRGFGFLGFPGRVGILPEITVIELVKV